MGKRLTFIWQTMSDEFGAFHEQNKTCEAWNPEHFGKSQCTFGKGSL